MSQRDYKERTVKDINELLPIFSFFFLSVSIYQEQELKLAADSVLCEVRKKQADVKRMQDILRSLEKLRKLRKEAASRKGENYSLLLRFSATEVHTVHNDIHPVYQPLYGETKSKFDTLCGRYLH